MSFLAPWMLWALPAVAIPVIVHLVNKRRHKVVHWGAMMFLLAGVQMSRGRERLRNFILLALRTAAVLGLVLAVGRPIAGGWIGRLGGARPDTVLVLVDRSASMAERVAPGGPSKLERGLERLAGALELTGAPTLVVLDSVSLDPRLIEEPADLEQLALEQATAGDADLPAMFARAAEFIRSTDAGRSEIWVLSDGQRSDWRPDDGRWESASQLLVEHGSGARVSILDLGHRAPGNVAVRVERARRFEDALGPAVELDFVVTRSVQGLPSAERGPVSVAIVHGGARSSLQVELEGDPGSEEQVARVEGHRVAIPSSDAKGWGLVELPGDAQPADDVAYFAYGDEAPLETVIVSERDDVRALVESAASAAVDPRATYSVRSLAPTSLSALELTGAALVVWCGPLPDGEDADLLRAHVDIGGQVLFLPPAAPDGRELFGVRWTRWRTASANALPRTWRGDDGLLARAADGLGLPVGDVSLYRVCTPEGDATTLAADDQGAPLLVRATTDRGGVHFLATLPTSDCSALGEDGLVWLALIHRALAAGADSLRAAPLWDAGREAAALLGEGNRWRPTDGAASPLGELGHHAGVVTDGERFVALGRSAAQDDADALATRASEAELEVSLEQRVGELLGGGVDVHVVGDAVAEDDGLVDEVWRAFLALVLVALMAEALICARESTPRAAAAQSPVPAGGRERKR